MDDDHNGSEGEEELRYGGLGRSGSFAFRVSIKDIQRVDVTQLLE